MGFGNVASENILFIAAVVVATGLVAALSGVVGGLTTGLEAQGNRLARGLQSDITIINDPENVVVSPDPIIYAKNIGSTSLLVDPTDVLIDGTPSASLTFDIIGSTNDEDWGPGQVLKIAVGDINPATGDHVVKVIAETGAEARFTFTS